MKGVQARRGSCRIISGKWRGRNIRFADSDGLRPTTDRIRETVFNWLQPWLAQSRCLDCFAGSGMLGFEALSRGAAEVIFIEHNATAAKRLQQNISLLEADNASVFHGDCLAWLQRAASDERLKRNFDIVFLDPPFQSDLLTRAGVLLESTGLLAKDAIIYVEHAVDANIVLPDNWASIKHKSSGQVSYKLFEKRG